jgi:hypothetical protein
VSSDDLTSDEKQRLEAESQELLRRAQRRTAMPQPPADPIPAASPAAAAAPPPVPAAPPVADPTAPVAAAPPVAPPPVDAVPPVLPPMPADFVPGTEQFPMPPPGQDPALAAPVPVVPPPAAPPPVAPEGPVEGQAAPPAPPPPAPAPMPQAAAGGEGGGSISDFIDEVQDDKDQSITDDEAGLRQAGRTVFAEVYGHLRVRVNADRNLEILDPSNGNRVASFIVPLNTRTRADGKEVKKAQHKLACTIASVGLAKAVSHWRGRAVQAAATSGAGVQGGGEDTFAEPREVLPDAKGTQGHGVATQTEQPSKGVPTSATSSGDGLTATDTHPTRKAPGLDGKAANVTPSGGGAPSGGVQQEGTRDMADPPKPPTSSEMDASKGGETTNADGSDKPRSTVLDDAVTTMANESVTGKNASSTSTPPSGEDLPLDALEARYKAHYERLAAKQVQDGVRGFIQRFTRCAQIAARRASLNLEDNHLKVAMADALMTEARVSATEDYVPMDGRTASFVIERGLGQEPMLQSLQALIHRTSELMRYDDPTLLHIEADLDRVQPVMPEAAFDPAQMAAAVVDPMAPMPVGADAMPPIPATGGAEVAPQPPPVPPPAGFAPEATPGAPPPAGGYHPQASAQHGDDALRRAAQAGNLSVNPNAGGGVQPPGANDAHMRIRAALSATRNGSFHNHLASRFG